MFDVVVRCAQSLATHLVRTYRDDDNPRPHRSTSLPAFQLHRVLKMMDASLDEGINVGKLAAAVKMSESHFPVRQRSPSSRSACRQRLPQGNRDQSPRVSGENAARRARGKF